ncbi:MAG: penicillin-binding transpeptidase domain-containing protein [Candidatus Omnitrophota bacterium]
MGHTIHKNRIVSVFIFFLILQSLLCARLFYLQIVRSLNLTKIADSQHKVLFELEPRRGTIYDRNMYKLAFNINADSVYAMPRDIPDEEKPAIASRLASILKMREESILDKLDRDKGFVWIKRKISEEEALGVRSQKTRGIDLIKESKRLYPNGFLAAHLLGFAGLDDEGLDGLELLYDKYLRGRAGYRATNRDAKRRSLPAHDEKFLAPVNGFNLVLNIDETIQNIAEQALDTAFRKYRASGAVVIVMEPRTGEILAFANRPTYDPNLFSKATADERRDRAVTDAFEPGSVFKIVTASCALEKGIVSPLDRFFCENGKYWVAGHTLHDHEPYGTLTFREVIEKSSNIGTVKVAQKIPPRDLYAFVKSFGFGQTTGVDLKGEIDGTTHPPERWSKATVSALPIGQEVTATVIQLTCAMAVIANGGNLVRPWIVREVRDDQGEQIMGFEPLVIRRAISEETARQMRDILQGVVERGTGTFARLETYTAAGKTGTAQKIDPSGLYSHSKFFASFIGFAPASDPRIVVAVCLDEPHPLYYGGIVSAPVFKKVAEDTLRYLGVPSDLARPAPLKTGTHARKD